MILFTYNFDCILKQGGAIYRNTRGSCAIGVAACTASCLYHGRYNGGCCGESYTKCAGTCYCKGVSVWLVSKLGKVMFVWYQYFKCHKNLWSKEKGIIKLTIRKLSNNAMTKNEKRPNQASMAIRYIQDLQWLIMYEYLLIFWLFKSMHQLWSTFIPFN